MRSRPLGFWSLILVLGLASQRLRAAETPAVNELRVQRAGGVTYFHVVFARPADLDLGRLTPGPRTEAQRRMFARLPRLVPQDGSAITVYPRLRMPDARPAVGFDEVARVPLTISGLEFVGVAGKVRPGCRHRFILLYPSPEKAGATPADLAGPIAPLLPTPGSWVEVPVELDLWAARELPALEQRTPLARRKASANDQANDLEGLWADAQAAHFAVLEALTPEFGFYGFACAATGRKYGVASPVLTEGDARTPEQLHRRLYETTTGAAAITESLQLRRLLGQGERDGGPRTVDVSTVAGIDIAEHPWTTMMAGKTPAPEPLAGLVPRDNYYIHFKDLRKLIEFGEFVEEWGSVAGQVYDMHSRDYRLKERYERQLCLRSTWLGKTLGPAVVRGVAITGNDAYLREGSDVTLIFHTVNPQAFLAGVDGFLREAKKEWGDTLIERTVDHDGVAIQVYQTPLREVSLHRATVGDFVVYSNSPTGIRRVLDARLRRLPALADSLDFQYMRTCFRADDRDEDGFLFLSDAFIRQLVGPRSKIKEKRRLEALTTLAMVTHGAMFSAWETGRLPVNFDDLLAGAGLKPQHLSMPEGNPVTWDVALKAAASDVYNTTSFATPLVELPIDRITAREQQEYNEFRAQYVSLWRRYFDPVGMRFALRGKQVKVDTYILPLLQSDHYATLRTFASGGTTPLDPAAIPSRARAHFVVHLGPFVRGLAGSGSPFGDRLTVSLDDGPGLDQLMALWVAQQLNPARQGEYSRQAARAALQLPVIVGIRTGEDKAFDQLFEQLDGFARALGGEPKPLPAYRDVRITRVEFSPDGMVGAEINRELKAGDRPLSPVLYHARFDGMWYVSFDLDTLKDRIDRALTRPPATPAAVPVNASLYLAPAAADRARSAFKAYLEWETHRRALANEPIWYALYRCGLARPGAAAEDNRAAARRYLGFVPASPDGTAYAYDARTDDVPNTRHGSLRRPRLHAEMDRMSPVNKLLEELQRVRADLRFREDGVYTTLTFDRQ